MESSKPLTPKLFLEDTYIFKLADCVLTNLILDEKDPLNLSLIFDRTIFHPQGGGQPSDIGFISDGITQYTVTELGYDKDRENVLHKLKIKDENEIKLFEIGKKFSLEIDEKRRRTNAKLHSAGHLLDVCVQSLGLEWIPGKGFHFEESPYVEYSGKITTDEKLKEVLTEKCNFLINSVEKGDAMLAKVYEYNEASKIMKQIPEFLPKDKPIRYVKLFNEDEGCPCGGTHVKHVSDIGGMKIVKIVKKGKNVRVSYQLS